MYKKLCLSIFAFFLLSIFSISFLALRVKAVSPIPPSGRIPCDQERNPEFNSLRPYQASPCGDSPKALFCGNALQIIEQTPSRTAPFGTKFLNVSITMPAKTYAVDLAGAEFPILGNTEDVKNSQSNTDSLDDASKVNEYTSWYLSGVNNKAEYGDTKNTDNEIVNLSGPVQKLLPSLIQDAQRIVSIENAIKEVQYPDEAQEGETIKGPQNHNQIVVCADKSILGVFGRVKAHECYSGGGAEAKNEYRLKDWEDHLPPLPWDPEFANDERKYLKARCEWEGGTNIDIPILNKSICIDNPFKSNEWADLYPYVPLASTTDKSAKNIITGVGINGSGGTEVQLPTIAYKVIQEPILYFPHTQETNDLVGLLNKTYAPGETGLRGSEDTANLSDVESPIDEKGQCRITDVRSNAGDYLFPEVKPSEVRVHVNSYTVTRIPCNDSSRTRTKPDGTEYEFPTAICKGEVIIGIRMLTKTPYADEIWNSAVAGQESVFRKIFPKTSENSPVSCIADLPTITNVTYTPTEGTNKLKVIGPEGGNSTDNPKLYFPHIGSVYEYFLKGIQTALRPKGYGEPIINGQFCNNIACGEMPKSLRKGSGSCNLGGVSSKVGELPESFRLIIEAAADTYKVPPNLILGIMYGEGAFNPGRYNWTEQNVKAWASCQNLPQCSPGGDVIKSVVPFIGSYWDNLSKAIAPDLQKLDPQRKEPNPCNLLDATFALAKDLSQDQNGSGAFSGQKCFGLPLNSGGGGSGSCNWDASDIETAIRVWEFGTAYGGEATCATLPGSCAAGGGFDAACPSGDNCERYSNVGNTSHNACVWDVAHGN